MRSDYLNDSSGVSNKDLKLISTPGSDVDVTLTASQSGSVIVWDASQGNELTLPSAQAGLHYQILFKTDSKNDASAKINAASGDCFFGQILVMSTTDDVDAVQNIPHGGTVADSNILTFDSNANTSGGLSGDMIELIAVDDVYWCIASCHLTTEGTNPASIAVAA